jgi:hypothetical protein
VQDLSARIQEGVRSDEKKEGRDQECLGQALALPQDLQIYNLRVPGHRARWPPRWVGRLSLTNYSFT